MMNIIIQDRMATISIAINNFLPPANQDVISNISLGECRPKREKECSD